MEKGRRLIGIGALIRVLALIVIKALSGIAALITMGEVIRIGVPYGIGALIYKNTFEGSAYFTEGAKSNY